MASGILEFFQSLPLWQSEVRLLRELTEADAKGDGDFLVQEGKSAFAGERATSPRVIVRLLRRCAIRPDRDYGDGVTYYTINETGRRILSGYEKERENE